MHVYIHKNVWCTVKGGRVNKNVGFWSLQKGCHARISQQMVDFNSYWYVFVLQWHFFNNKIHSIVEYPKHHLISNDFWLPTLDMLVHNFMPQWGMSTRWRLTGLLSCCLTGLRIHLRDLQMSWSDLTQVRGYQDISLNKGQLLDDVIIWKYFPRYWPFMRGFHRSTVNSPHKGYWRRALMFSLICAEITVE